ncbi:MAG: hypothetical protein KBC57_13330 [Neisseriaceae bacterium]|nr:hypothetical protein [Neisseriaceae bacterium]
MLTKKTTWLTLPLLSLALYGCAQPSAPTVAATPIEPAILGDYVSDGYAERAAGYDWVAVSLKEGKDQQIKVSVRSRNDRKKPTCTFDGYAKKTGAQTYTTTANGQPVTLTVTPTQLTIAADTTEGAGALAYFCSGGATLAGSYDKLPGSVDPSQLDPSLFNPRS